MIKTHYLYNYWVIVINAPVRSINFVGFVDIVDLVGLTAFASVGSIAKLIIFRKDPVHV